MKENVHCIDRYSMSTEEQKIKIAKALGRPLRATSPTGQIIDFLSSGEAANELTKNNGRRFYNTSISGVCNGGHQHCKGWKFEYMRLDKIREAGILYI